MFKIGYCVNCGEQAMVLDNRHNPVRGLDGTKVCWLTLSSNGEVVTRVGTFPVCGKCDPKKVNLEALKKDLIDTPNTGISGKEPELYLNPDLGIEVVKTFGE